MKGKICGLLSALFITLGLSLSINLNDTSALKHDITAIPYFVPQNSSNNVNTNASIPAFYQPLTMRSTESIAFKPLNYMKLTQSGSQCSYLRTVDINELNTTSSYYQARYNGTYYVDFFDYREAVQSVAECNPLGEVSNLNNSSVPGNISHYIPYRYPYDGLYVSDTYIENGFHRGAKLDFAELFVNNQLPSTFTYIQIPFGIASSGIGSITSGRNISFEGEFMFDSDNPDTDEFILNSSSSFTLRYEGYKNQADFTSQNMTSASVTCSYSVSRNTNQDEYPWILDYTCPFVSPVDFTDGHIGFYLQITGNPIWTYPSIVWLYESAIVVTDNDRTPSDQPFSDFQVQGNDSDEAPGSAAVSENETDWFQSLINLFSFNFLNPFAPIFNLFSNQDSCAQIPTISGMIHSEETEVCPWFNSTVRNITTPVLGLASMMLIFGFAVRWLGSSSGNLFEDSGSHDVGNIRVKQRGK